jgi:hypothetical protein
MQNMQNNMQNNMQKKYAEYVKKIRQLIGIICKICKKNMQTNMLKKYAGRDTK